MSLHKMPATSGLLSWLRRRAPWIFGTLFIICGISGVAHAYWQSADSSNTNFAAATADTLPQGSAPTATATGATTVAISWPASTTGGGRAVTGYTIARYDAATGGTQTAATGGCAGTITGTSCTEQSVPGGTWHYAVTPTLSLWSGAESSRSMGVTIDTTAPTAAITFPVTGTTYKASSYTAGCSPTGICGTASDATGVASVKVSIRQGTSNYWNGTSFGSATEVFQTATGTTSWNYPLALPTDGSYTVHVQTTDTLGNALSGTSYAATSTFTIDTTAPTVTSITLANGTTLGTADNGDSVVIQYSEQMDATKFCSTWTNSGIQSLSSNNDVTVSIADNGTNDTLTATSATCTLQLGSVALGGNYVPTGGATFRGPNAGKSTISWDPSTQKLTITLGNKNTGTVNPSVVVGTPVYTPASGLSDLVGNALSTSAVNGTSSRF
jgi:hypothetical protein